MPIVKITHEHNWEKIENSNSPKFFTHRCKNCGLPGIQKAKGMFTGAHRLASISCSTYVMEQILK